MTAIKIIDSHLELANIGTNTHAQIDTHIADPSAHHIKYTDAEAVSALVTADKYIKNDSDDTMIGKLTIKKNLYPQLLVSGDNTSGVFDFSAKDASNVTVSQMRLFAYLGGANQVFIQSGIATDKAGIMFLTGLDGVSGTSLTFKFEKIDFDNNIIKNPKNHVASALSGTKKLIELDIGGVPYYFEVYPTKA